MDYKEAERIIRDAMREYRDDGVPFDVQTAFGLLGYVVSKGKGDMEHDNRFYMGLKKIVNRSR